MVWQNCSLRTTAGELEERRGARLKEHVVEEHGRVLLSLDQTREAAGALGDRWREVDRWIGPVGKTRWSSGWLRGGSGKIPRGMVSGWRRRDGTRGRIFRVRLELIYI